MNNYSEFALYEELAGFFDLEGEELLSKMYSELIEISVSYYGIESFVRNTSGNVVVFLNDYQLKITEMYTTLVTLWLKRN